MRILHVTATYHPATRYGGPIASVHGLARALARRGHDVWVCTTSVDGPEDSGVPLDRPVVIDGVNVLYFRSPALRRLYFSPSMARWLGRNAGRFGVVHIHALFLWPTLCAARAARRAGTPAVMAPRGMLVRDLVRRKSRLLKSLWIGLFERRNLEKAQAVHATTEAEAEEIRAFGFRLPRVFVLPNGIDTAGDAAPPAPPPGLPDPGYVLFLGRINWKKGLDRLIPALRAVPAARLVVCGNDEEGYTPQLVRLARESGVAERVHFAGPVHGDAKRSMLARAAVLALSSYSENFGNVVLEAMSEGVPVAVTPEVGLAAVVRETRCGAVLDGAPAVFGAGLAGMLADPARLREMGENGRRAVREHFTWDAVAAEAERLYASLRTKP